jgi:hypothetical protein
MAMWKTVFDGAIGSRPVKIELFGNDDDADDAAAARITTMPMPTVSREPVEGERGMLEEPVALKNAPLVIEPAYREDLLAELQRAGFTEAQIEKIVSYLPEDSC